MHKHVTVLGALYIAFGILGLIAAIVVFVAVAGGGWLSRDHDVVAITTTIAVLIGGFLTLLSIPAIVGGAGLMKHAPWARILVLILGVINIFNIPFGTVLAIYTLWVLLNDETARMFSESSAAAVP